MQYHTFIVQIDTVVFIQLTQQMFYESILHEPIQKYKMEVKREVVLKGTLHKEGSHALYAVSYWEAQAR